MPQKDTGTEYQVTWLIRRLFRAMARFADGYLEPFGITAAERAALEFLYPDAALSVPAIASRYGVSRQHVQVTANSLVGRGLVERRDNPRHKRSPLMALTHDGRTLFDKVRREEARLVRRLFTDIPPHDVETTRRTLEAMYFDNLAAGDAHANDQ